MDDRGSERTCTVPDKMADDIHAEHKIRKRVHEEDEEDDLDLRSIKKHKQDSPGTNETSSQCSDSEYRCAANTTSQRKPCGLVNLGNTCYMNAALQCLGSVVPLKKFFMSQEDLNSRDHIAHEVSSVIRQMWSQQPLRTAVHPTNIMDEIGKRNNRFSGGTQQDSQEFLLCLLEKLHAAMKESCSEDHSSVSNTSGEKLHAAMKESCSEDHSSVSNTSGEKLHAAMKESCSEDHNSVSNTSGDNEAERKWREYLNLHGRSIVVELFEGQFQSSMKCEGCGEWTHKFDPFMFLPTPIPSAEHKKQNNLTLLDCLNVIFKEETFDGKAWSCSKCHQKTDMKRKLSISRMPCIVMVYLKRFQNDMYGRRVKLNTEIKFPFRDLDLSSFMSSTSQNQPSPQYKLFSVINHSGTINGGHYTAYAEREGQWYHFNDEYVTQCSEDKVMSHQAYVLFYGKQSGDTEDNVVGKVLQSEESVYCANKLVQLFAVVLLTIVVLITIILGCCEDS